MRRPRDSQRSKVYLAEGVLNKHSTVLTTVEHVEAFAAKIWDIKRFHETYPRAFRWHKQPPRVKDGRGTRNATGGRYAINIPLWARNTRIVTHELAHTVSLREYDDIAYHGWEFCAVFLDLTLTMMGEDAHADLLESFKKHGVRYKKPGKRVMTDEQRQALIARMEMVRAARKKD